MPRNMRWHHYGTLRNFPERWWVKDTLWITLQIRLQNSPLREPPAPLRRALVSQIDLQHTVFIDSISNGLFQGMMRPQELARTLRKVLEWHICWGKGWIGGVFHSSWRWSNHTGPSLCVTEHWELPQALVSHGDRRCSSSAECQAAFALAGEAEMPTGSLGRGRELGGHHPNALWKGAAGQKVAVSPAPHFFCVHQPHNAVEIPL